MNRINPHKLLLSKWTAVEPQQKERHFMVTKLIRAENADIIACELEAVINNTIYEIEWQALKDSSCRGVAIFAKAFMGIPAQQAAKTTRPLMPAAAPAVLVTRSLPNKG